MKLQRHVTAYVLFSFCLLLAVLACGRVSEPSQEAADDARRIALLHLGDHRVINAVVKGFRMRLEELAPPDKFLVSVYDANFDMTNLPSMSRAMVNSDADVLVSVTTPASNALVGANRGTKPQVFTFVTDVSQLGYKGPGSIPNVTGLSDQVDYEGVLSLIRKLQPRSSTIGYLITQSESNAQLIFSGFERRAGEYGFEIRSASIAGASDLRMAANALVDDVDLFLFGGDNAIAENLEILFDAARAHGKPVYANDELSVESGALAAISVDYLEMGERTAEYTVLLLGGAQASSVPLEVMKADQLIVNLRTARSLGIEIPASLLDRAHRVIE